jgi:hypothetical protein
MALSFRALVWAVDLLFCPRQKGGRGYPIYFSVPSLGIRLDLIVYSDVPT